MATKTNDKGLSRIINLRAGIDNMSRDPRMERDQNGFLIAVRKAVNVDIDNDGIASRRRGMTKIDSGAHRSAFAAKGWPFGLVLRGTELCAFTADVTTPLLGGFAPWDDLTFAEIRPGHILWSDGSRNGVITDTMQIMPAGVAVPPPCDVDAVAVGGCAEGWYQVTATWQRYASDGGPDGEESGAAEAFDVFVPEGGGIQLSNIPQPDDPTIARLCAYVSTMGGAVMYRSTTVPIGVTTYVVGPNPDGKPLETLLLEPIPPANIYRMFNGVLLAACGRTLRWSQTLHPTLTDYAKNRIPFSGSIDMLEPISQDAAAGVWVAAKGRTFFLEGQHPTAEGQAWSARAKHPYGVVPGSSRIVPARAFNPEASGNAVFWLDTAGHWCTGSAGGVVERKAAERFNAGVPDRASCFFRERGGLSQVVTSVDGAINDNFNMRDSMSIRVMRNGVEVQP